MACFRDSFIVPQLLCQWLSLFVASMMKERRGRKKSARICDFIPAVASSDGGNPKIILIWNLYEH
jgi:hypothetical protein